MIDIQAIKEFFPPIIRENPEFQKHMIKEYIQCQILEHISNSPYCQSLAFIGGTCLRLVKKIDRFSEDLDFDCKQMSVERFQELTDDILRYLSNCGYDVETKSREHDGLVAFRRSFYFPELMFSLGLSGYRNARFLIKIEMQYQGFDYKPEPAFIRACGFYFPIPVPPNAILCSMKLLALLNRTKGRDFYDAMFLLSQTKPDYPFLIKKAGIHDEKELREALQGCLAKTDLSLKQKDFEHLLFSRAKSTQILHFNSFLKSIEKV
jgi:predicted nucleotidyltransferase component of viral defense system